MNIQVFNREAFENFETDEPHIAISITDPGSKPAKFINEKNSLLDKLELSFYDLDQDTGNFDYDKFMFNESHAKHIFEFVTKYDGIVKTILVHCEAGISRSAGVAGALGLIYNEDDDIYFEMYCPNRLVYRSILEVYEDDMRS